MNKSTIRKQAVASTNNNPRFRVAMGLLAVAWMLVSIPRLAFANPQCTGIHVKILDIRNSKGTIACALFSAPDGFPTEYLKSATNIMVIKVKKAQARCDFEDIPHGTYALAVIHDENMNGKLDTNALGIPKEGYGFSKDAKGAIGAPSFSAASFPYDGKDLELTITLHY